MSVPGREQLEGYVHIIAVETASEPPPNLDIPQSGPTGTALPTDFKSGYHFSIKNYIDIKVRMFLNKETDNTLSHLKLLMYDESGALILNQEFDVGAVS